ncbi:MAG: glycosyltransferase family 39 protein [Pseudonocardiaceae bacterium]
MARGGARIFGVNPWSILIPQALEGVAAVGVLYAAVRRWHGPGAGLLAGATLALTPVAALIFRFNDPDALLVLLLTLSAYVLVRALEAASTRWLLAAAAFIGFAFLTKSLQAFLVCRSSRCCISSRRRPSSAAGRSSFSRPGWRW